MPSPIDAGGVLEFPVLVGDIGGTNARFAILPGPDVDSIEFPTVATADFPDIDIAIERAILARSPVRPKSAVLAIAAPVTGDEIRLTNCPWTVRPRVLIDRLGFSEVVILNDFEAQALAVVAIGQEHCVQIGGGPADPNASRVVLGPGTGLGVAGLINANGVWIPVPGEGGHVDMGPRTARDFEVFPHIEPIEGRISGEQILCGRGLVNLYRAVALADAEPAKLSTPASVTSAALARTDGVAEEALDIFVTCLGRLAGDLALIFMARGGVYLTGGIAQKIVAALQHPRFRAAFEDKAPHSALMRQLPVFVITHPLAALLGLAAYARTPQAFHIRTTGRHWRASKAG
ncbi:glucokinase [Aliihoeflea aestuarii]|jgi:glucokinase|uniref:glucokinase n=1 Tax=Aliihoeflea aestuarii TaxID=453840 RepID=UPI002092001E|nr:glucokinase [Aliihoeflea aestuarii]MCO6390966.1 glucokinase [Aliihoeflea aestuarii]